MNLTDAIFGLVPGLVTKTLDRLGVTSSGAYVPLAGKIVAARRAAAQTIAHNTSTPISWDTELRDNDGQADYSGAPTKLFTCTRAGAYTIDASVAWDSSATGQRILSIFVKNASNTTIMDANATIVPGVTGGIYQSISRTFTLAATDYVQIVVYQTSGGDLAINPGGAEKVTATATFQGA